MKPFLLFAMLLCGCLAKTSAQENRQDILLNLDENWYFFDSRENLYVPVLPFYHEGANSISQWIPLADYQANTLEIGCEHGSALFINNQLYRRSGEAQLHTFPIDALQQQFGDTILLTIFSRNITSRLPTCRIMRGGALQVQNAVLSTIDPVRFPEHERWNQSVLPANLLNLLSILTVAFFAFAFARNSPFSSLFSVDRYLFKLFQGGQVEEKASFTDRIVYVLFLAACHTLFLLYLIRTGKRNTFAGWFWSDAVSDNFLADNLIKIFLIFLAIGGLRIALLYVMGSLYSIRSGLQSHLYEHIQSNNLLYSLLLILAVMLQLGEMNLGNLFLTCFTLALLAQAAFTTYRVNKMIPYKRVYLISYFCMTEFIPVLITVKLFIGS